MAFEWAPFDPKQACNGPFVISSQRLKIVKKVLCAVLTTAMLAPFACFAQTAGDNVTRAQVRDERAQLEATGYRPSTHDADYPNALQAAEAKVQMAHEGAPSYSGARDGSASISALEANHTAVQ
jgi:hypothetical protein